MTKLRECLSSTYFKVTQLLNFRFIITNLKFYLSLSQILKLLKSGKLLRRIKLNRNKNKSKLSIIWKFMYSNRSLLTKLYLTSKPILQFGLMINQNKDKSFTAKQICPNRLQFLFSYYRQSNFRNGFKRIAFYSKIKLQTLFS